MNKPIYSKVVKVGSDLAIIIPDVFVKKFNLKEGSEIYMSLDITKKAIIVTFKKNDH